MKQLVTVTIALVSVAWTTATGQASSRDVDPQALGVWQLEFTAPDGVHRNPLIVVGRQYDSLVAWYVAEDEPQQFQNVRLQGDRIVGILVPREHRDVTVTCEAALTAANRCEGKATYRTHDGTDSGQWEFTGKRLEPASLGQVTRWSLQFTTPDQQRYDAVVTVVVRDGKQYAWYSSADHELPARSMKVQGNRVDMKMVAESPRGIPVEVTFRGTLAGDTVKGDAEYRLAGDSGSFPFQAKRLP